MDAEEQEALIVVYSVIRGLRQEIYDLWAQITYLKDNCYNDDDDD
tara:strand:+ start:1168 stop:1302 length:135 start_codon:yes stop_codon:yes gene_type:complete